MLEPTFFGLFDFLQNILDSFFALFAIYFNIHISFARPSIAIDSGFLPNFDHLQVSFVNNFGAHLKKSFSGPDVLFIERNRFNGHPEYCVSIFPFNDLLDYRLVPEDDA